MVGTLKSVKWLKENLGAAEIVVLDATWHMPDSGRDAKAEYEKSHIPGARFFDIDAVADTASGLPHTVPSPNVFASAVSALGIKNTDTVIFYDNSDVKSAARGWWLFRLFGHNNVYVLDGGMQAWRASHGTVQSGHSIVPVTDYAPDLNEKLIKYKSDIKNVINSDEATLVDARAQARFEGSVPEPRPGLKAGHMPGAKNLPFGSLFKDDHTYLDKESLHMTISSAGIGNDKPIITTCGSGVTACVLMMAMAITGNEDVAIYDGSWSEWGGLDDAEIETGPVNE